MKNTLSIPADNSHFSTGTNSPATVTISQTATHFSHRSEHNASITVKQAMINISIRSLQELARAMVPIPMLSLPVEVLVLILDKLNHLSQLSLMQTCGTLRNIYPQQHRDWLIFTRNCLSLITQYTPQHPNNLLKLEKCYQIILARLLSENISGKECSETASLAEKFFSLLPRRTIKKHANNAFSKRPSASDWHAIFEQLARCNLHLCLTLIALASPGFDSAPLMRFGWVRYPRYPFTEYYPFLEDKLSFAQTETPPLIVKNPHDIALANPRLSFPQTKTRPLIVKNPHDIALANPRAQTFFCQLREDHGYNTALHFAVMTGYVDIIPALVHNHPLCIDLPDENGRTALMIVCIYHNRLERTPTTDYTKIIRTLLEFNADPDRQDNYGNTALAYLSQENNLEIIRLLLKHGANSQIPNREGITALLYASKADLTDHAETIRLLLEHGADVRQQDRAGETALFYARQPQTVLLLLQHGAQVNHRNVHQTTVLMHTCGMSESDRQVDIAALLLQYGADINMSNKHGLTALMYACQKGNLHLINLLLTYNPDLEAQDEEDLTAFMHACREGHTEIARLLLRHGAQVGRQDKKGLTAFIHAGKNGHIETLRFLLQLDTQIGQHERNMALLHACASQDNEMAVQILLAEAKADPDQRDSEEQTPLMHAIQVENIKTIHLLLEHSAHVGQQDKQGLTALVHASAKGLFEAVSLLIKHSTQQSIENLQKDIRTSSIIVQTHLQQHKDKKGTHLTHTQLRQYEHIATKLKRYLPDDSYQTSVAASE